MTDLATQAAELIKQALSELESRTEVTMTEAVIVSEAFAEVDALVAALQEARAEIADLAPREADLWDENTGLKAALQTAEAREKAVTEIVNDWVKCGNHTQEWQFYINQLYAALPGTGTDCFVDGGSVTFQLGDTGWEEIERGDPGTGTEKQVKEVNTHADDCMIFLPSGTCTCGRSSGGIARE